MKWKHLILKKFKQPVSVVQHNQQRKKDNRLPTQSCEEDTRDHVLHYFKIARQPNYQEYVAYAQRKNQNIRQIATFSEIEKYYGRWEGMLTALNSALVAIRFLRLVLN